MNLANATLPTPSDIVAALMYYTGSTFLAADPQKLHGAIREAQSVCPLLNRFTFSQAGVAPMSRSFDDALSILKLSRIVRMENTDYRRYILDADARNYMATEILPLFSDEEKSSLAQAAAIVREACQGVSPVPTEVAKASVA